LSQKCLPLKKLAIYFINNSFVRAVQRACTLLIPLILIDSLCYLIACLPIPSFQNFLFGDGYILRSLTDIVVDVNDDFLGIIFVFLIGISYRRDSKINGVQKLSCAITCVICFLINIGYGRDDFSLDYVGKPGMFSAIITCFIACPLFYIAYTSFDKLMNNKTKMVDPYLSTAIRSVPILTFVPITFYVIRDFVWFFTGYLNLQEFLFEGVARGIFNLLSFSDILQTIVYLFLTHIIWLTGTNGKMALDWIRIDEHMVNSHGNMIAAIKGGGIPNIVTCEFINSFCCIGGAGCVLALAILSICKSKKKTERGFSTLALVPTVFNINEVLTYGVPLIMNPLYVIPYIAAPIVNACFTYFFMYFEIVPRTINGVDWAMPIIFSGYISTSDIRGALLQIFLLLVDVMIYYPFYKLSLTFRENKYKNSIRDLEVILREKEIVEEPFRIDHLDYANKYTARRLSNDLREDIKNGKLAMFYQAQSLPNGEYAGAEALIRWKHESAGYIYPPLVIALAKEGGFLNVIEHFIFDSAASTIHMLEEDGKLCPKISVNITGTSMAYTGFEEMIDSVVSKYGIQRSNLCIEITEQESIASIKALSSIREKGHVLYIDDFGMGHTSIYYLESGIFEVVKLDGFIISRILTDDNAHEIVRSVIKLSHKLNMKVYAEYVETTDQKEELKKMGCDVFQGGLYSKALPKEEFYKKIIDIDGRFS